MNEPRKIELLAPAKNADYGIEAILHGADAVYIGAPMFGARASAGNTVSDIERLSEFAHRYHARVYVAMNTILEDKDLVDAERLLHELYNAGTDAVIIQDMGILQLQLPPIALHASTQMDNRTVAKAVFLEQAGFSQIVLARELSLDEIAAIARSVTVPIEVFVHGALCVSYSGQCYLSNALTGRSANRGTCSQPCRLPYDITDSRGRVIAAKCHALSMKDLNRTNDLEALLDAGVSSLKIEGRLKDLTYIKNTVSLYRRRLDEILARRQEFERDSDGESRITFEPNMNKTFNRGFTDYFLYFFNHRRELEGIQVNRVDDNRVFPLSMPVIKKGTKVFRNNDREFDKLLSSKTAERKIAATIDLYELTDGFRLVMTDEKGYSYQMFRQATKEPAQKDQTENIRTNLSKTGQTIFTVTDVRLHLTSNVFIPASVLSQWRRELTDGLLCVRLENHPRRMVDHKPTHHAFPEPTITYLGNVANGKARSFYEQHGSEVIQPAFEIKRQKDVPLMFTRHCIKYSLGWCPKYNKAVSPYTEPFYLTHSSTRLRLEFDCQACEMRVYQV